MGNIIAAEPIRTFEQAVRAWKQTFLQLNSLDAPHVHAQADNLYVFGVSQRDRNLMLGALKLRYWKGHGVRAINFGGTMGSGKSQCAEALSVRLGANWECQDADQFHTEHARKKMQRGEALTDDERKPFFRNVRHFLEGSRKISSCSALRSDYRAVLSGQDTDIIGSPSSNEIWQMSRPNLGLLQVLLYKPYEIALEQLDASNTGRTKKRSLDGGEHFIEVTKESEKAAREKGKKGLLESQYDLLGDPSRIPPWEALVIHTESFYMSDRNEYQMDNMLSPILRLPFPKKPEMQSLELPAHW